MAEPLGLGLGQDGVGGDYDKGCAFAPPALILTASASGGIGEGSSCPPRRYHRKSHRSDIVAAGLH